MKFQQQFDQLTTYLTGEFDRIIFEDAIAGATVHEEHGIILPSKHLTELDRVSYLVNQIERDC